MELPGALVRRVRKALLEKMGLLEVLARRVRKALLEKMGSPGENGFDGSTGPTGAQGDPGEDGTDGGTGPTGAQGPPGENGVDGNDGGTGSTGPTGSQGPPGENGVDGTNGIDGVTGQTGSTGATGSQGPPGENGVDGTDGNDGATGQAGPTGPQGPPGENGEDGVPGQAGVTGQTGPGSSTNIVVFSTGVSPLLLNGTGGTGTTDFSILGFGSSSTGIPISQLTPAAPLNYALAGFCLVIPPTAEGGLTVTSFQAWFVTSGNTPAFTSAGTLTFQLYSGSSTVEFTPFGPPVTFAIAEGDVAVGTVYSANVAISEFAAAGDLLSMVVTVFSDDEISETFTGFGSASIILS
jgi:hypothetical protein